MAPRMARGADGGGCRGRAEEIVVTAGATAALEALAFAVCGPGDASPGRHRHSTLSLTVIGYHSLGIYTVILLSMLSLSVGMAASIAPGLGDALLAPAPLYPAFHVDPGARPSPGKHSLDLAPDNYFGEHQWLPLSYRSLLAVSLPSQ
jgi:hypothetical protein